MSVHRSRRTVAFSEFERQSIALLKYTHGRMKHTPARYKKFVCPKIYELTNKACASAIFANEQYPQDPLQLQRRINYVQGAIGALETLQYPLWIYWNLFETKDGGQQDWSNRINNTLALLCGVIKDVRSLDTVRMIRPLPVGQIRNAKYLHSIAELQRYTYGKIVHEPKEYKDYILDAIAHYVDGALCSAIEGNSIIPTNRAEYEARRRKLLHARDCINGLQRPLYALWNAHSYSENVMQKWANLIEDSLKLLTGVIKADQNRYGDLV